jgi:hypothetical protein
VAPALHSLIIRERNDVERFVGILVDSHVDLTKLMLKICDFCKHGNSIIANIADRYRDLEVLTLERCNPLTSADYYPISLLKNLSELNISHSHVSYVKPSQTHVCVCEHM